MSEHWRNRITGSGVVDATALTAHPLNFRDHPVSQRDAVDGLLDSVGWLKEVIVNERTGRVIDGHLRVERAEARGESVPVQYVDLSENEEAVVLASLDPLAEAATTDREQLDDLLGAIDDDAEAFGDLKRRVAEVHGIGQGEGAGGDEPSNDDGKASFVRCPRCSHEWEPAAPDE